MIRISPWLKTKLILSIGAGFYFVGACAPKNFEQDTNCGSGCVIQAGYKVWDYRIIPKAGKIDIVIINDNSASMSFEQAKIAERFGNFLQNLDSQNVDYRIGMITTDVSTSTNGPSIPNGNGAWQDGKLIRFADGSSWIENTNPNRVQIFAHALRRNETLSCENFLKDNPNVAQESSAYLAKCPSGDERGIYAAHLMVEREIGNFLRPGADLAMVLLSDEDVRSGLYDRVQSFRMEAKDRPETLLAYIQNRAPEKNFRFHSIIVRPGDTACLQNQASQLGFGASFGVQYAKMSEITSGILADICSSDYATPLAQIADNIHESFLQHQLKCSDPKPLDGASSVVSFTPSSNTSVQVLGDKIFFDPGIIAGTVAHLQYRCPN